MAGQRLEWRYPRQQGHLFAGLRQAPADISAHGTRAKNRDTHSPSAQRRHPQERGLRLRAPRPTPRDTPDARACPHRTRAPCRAATQAMPPASLCLKRRRVKSRGWRGTPRVGGTPTEPGERGGLPRRMGGKTCQRWKANTDARGSRWRTWGLRRLSAGRRRRRPVLAATAGQQTLWRPLGRLRDRCRPGGIAAWRLHPPESAHVGARLRWGEDEAT